MAARGHERRRSPPGGSGSTQISTWYVPEETLRRFETSSSGDATLDMGPGSLICTPAFGMGGVGVRLGVRVGGWGGVAFKSWGYVAVGARLAVDVGLNAGEVGLGPLVAAMTS